MQNKKPFEIILLVGRATEKLRINEHSISDCPSTTTTLIMHSSGITFECNEKLLMSWVDVLEQLLISSAHK